MKALKDLVRQKPKALRDLRRLLGLINNLKNLSQILVKLQYPCMYSLRKQIVKVTHQNSNNLGGNTARSIGPTSPVSCRTKDTNISRPK